MFGSMKHGENRRVEAGGQEYSVDYHSQQSHGDNGKPVRGATTGTFTVNFPDGKSSYHRHGPHAETEQGAKSGANRQAKPYAARLAQEAIHTHAVTSGVFNDRRGYDEEPPGAGEDVFETAMRAKYPVLRR